MIIKILSKMNQKYKLLTTILMIMACEPVGKNLPYKDVLNEQPVTKETDNDDAPITLKTTQEELLNPSIFNWQFYLQANPDLLLLGLRTREHAQNHWLRSGAAEGRQAHPNFHSKQYLGLYKKVSKSCKKDKFKCAISNYLSIGILKSRRGYVDGGKFGRYTLSNGVLTLSASERVAGAIDSVFFRNRELLNSFDHGRQLQVAFTKNGLGECYNPTEGGQERDGLGKTSASVLESISIVGNLLQTRNRPAFWLRPGQESIPQQCGGARNVTILSDYRFEKAVTLGWNNNPNIIEFIVKVSIPENEEVASYAFEGPTGYLTHEFTSYYTLTNGALKPTLHDPMGEQSDPLIFATADGSVAMGVYSPDFANSTFDGPRYGKFAYLSPSNLIDKSNKWNLVFRKGATAAGTYTFRTFIVVGELELLKTQMPALVSLFK